MDLAARFLAYANDFEHSYADRNWDRLAPYFAADAVYESAVPAALAFRVEGREAILARFAMATDAFDRRFDSRTLRLDPPRLSEQRVTVTGVATYGLAGAPSFSLPFAEVADYRGDEIVRLEDSAAPECVQQLADWMARYGSRLRS